MNWIKLYLFYLSHTRLLVLDGNVSCGRDEMRRKNQQIRNSVRVEHSHTALKNIAIPARRRDATRTQTNGDANLFKEKKFGINTE